MTIYIASNFKAWKERKPEVFFVDDYKSKLLERFSFCLDPNQA